METLDEFPTSLISPYFSGGATNEYWNTWCGSTINTVCIPEPLVIKKDEVKLLGDKLKELGK